MGEDETKILRSCCVSRQQQRHFLLLLRWCGPLCRCGSSSPPLLITPPGHHFSPTLLSSSSSCSACRCCGLLLRLAAACCGLLRRRGPAAATSSSFFFFCFLGILFSSLVGGLVRNPSLPAVKRHTPEECFCSLLFVFAAAFCLSSLVWRRPPCQQPPPASPTAARPSRPLPHPPPMKASIIRTAGRPRRFVASSLLNGPSAAVVCLRPRCS